MILNSTAAAFNVLLFGGVKGSNFTFDLINGEVEGRVAVNGSLRAINFGIGTLISPCNSSLATVVVGGANSTIDFRGGLQCGSLVTESTTNVLNAPGFTNGRLLLGSSEEVVNFTAAASELNATSFGFCNATTGIPATVSQFREITFDARSSINASLIFTVNVTDLNRAASVRFRFANASAVQSVVVVLRGNQSLTLTNFGIDYGALSAYTV